MRQVTAVGKIQSHESVSGFETGQEHGHVCLCAGMRLHVGILGPE